MRNTLALAAVAMLAISAPALAQSNGSPGAAPAGSGSNTPGSAVQPNRNYPDQNGAMNNGAAGGDMSEGRAAAPNTANSHMDATEPNAANGAMQPRGGSAAGAGTGAGSTGGGAAGSSGK